jgi:soluble lytic murein transglycosylase-like protein
MSVKSVHSEAGQLALHLRGGGIVYADPGMIVRVEPDEVEYDDEIASRAPEEQADSAPDLSGGTLRALVSSTAVRHGVDPKVVDALIRVESAYRAGAVSPKGARGLMQIMPTTGRQYGGGDLLDPVVNVETGVRHLKRLLERYTLPVALAAYNAGETAVDRFGGIPPFRETRNYVARSLQLLARA